MNKKKVAGRAAAVALTSVMAFGALGFITGCKKDAQKLVIMSENLDGLFNPFFSTAAPDMEIVGMTQISMLSTDSAGELDYGEDEPTVVLDYKSEYDAGAGTTGKGVTTHYFVLKNGLTFADGMPITMNDVLFNMYVYLDPVYTGSTTMYSTDIVGLSQYRTQTVTSGTDSVDETISKNAQVMANTRVNEMLKIYKDSGKTPTPNSYELSVDEMNAAIDAYSGFTDGFKEAVSYKTLSEAEYRAQLKADYKLTTDTFRKELETDYEAAKDSYKDSSPYKETGFFNDEVFSFMFMEGYVTVSPNGWTDTSHTAIKPGISSFQIGYNRDGIKTKEDAINYVFNDKISTALIEVLNYFATASTVRTEFAAKARENILHQQLGDNEGLIIKNVEGIKSMGHSTDVSTLTIKDKEYKIAKEYNKDGTVKNSGEYAVLRVQVNGVDPKAVWNFSFTVAPHHYYSNPSDPNLQVDIASNKFGVEWGSFDFMKNVLQGNNAYGVSKNQVPMGAGAYQATNSDNADLKDVKGNAFNSNGSVYFKSNDNFILGEPKIKNIVYQVVQSTDALNVLENGSVHFVTPQLTPDNERTIKDLAGKGIKSTSTWQLGYGYIGVNAGKVPDINLRKAIMSAMDISLVKTYYSFGTVENIAWPMSVVSWAYPREEGTTFNPSQPTENMEQNNGKDWMQFPTGDNANEEAKTKIRSYTGSKAGTSETKLKFTIAGANLTEHPVYAVFTKAAELLNACGWTVEVVPDNNALTKLSTGSLAVWAAAWGTTNDPDMYQVYHKNSTATSVLSWGYREILANQGSYSYEYNKLVELSKKIDAGRQTDKKDERTKIYREAMGMVLDLAVEMPAYQRRELFVYNAKVIDENTFPKEINSYSSPLGEIWNIDFVK